MDNSSICIVSFCTLEHKDVWIRTSRLLPKFVQADEYKLYVPDVQVKSFKEISNKDIQVIPESSLYKSFYDSLKQKIKKSNNEKRFNWYLQQFLKIQSLISNNSRKLVIWDSDCVPLKPLIFFKEEVPIYMKSTEFHKEYFEFIEKALNLKRIQNHSFITPGFPILKTWVTQFINEIETKNNKSWIDVFIEHIDFSQISGFSEFETLGTWITNRHQKNFEFSDYTWERYGQSRFGEVSSLEIEELVDIGLKHELDIVSFENWDVVSSFSRKVVKKIKNSGLKICC